MWININEREGYSVLDDRNSMQSDKRNLSEVFRELQEIQRNPQKQLEYQKAYQKASKAKKKKKAPSISLDTNPMMGKGIKLSNLIIACIVILMSVSHIFSALCFRMIMFLCFSVGIFLIILRIFVIFRFLFLRVLAIFGIFIA